MNRISKGLNKLDSVFLNKEPVSSCKSCSSCPLMPAEPVKIVSKGANLAATVEANFLRNS